MTKIIRFTLFLLSLLVTLVILGNLAATVRANGAGNIDVTPIPTIMPTETPPGAIPSADEHEALKAD